MKQTLATWDIYHITGVGSTPKLRLAADQDFVASTGELVLQGNAEENYVEITPTLVGTTLIVPNIEDIDTNDDSSQPNGTYTLYLVNSQGKKPRVVLEQWRFTASMGDVVLYEDLEVYNNNKVPLRDADTYSKNQINVLFRDAINVGNPATTSAIGRVKLRRAPSNAAAPVVIIDDEFDELVDDLAAHAADTTNVHGIADTSKLVVTTDPRVVQVSNQASLALAISLAGATPTTLQVTTAIDDVDNLTIPANVTLKFIRSGSIEVNTGQTLTILGPIIADDVQIFFNALAGQGTVSLVDNRYVREIHVAWWGAVADGVTDNTEEIQAPITCAGTAKGMVVKLANTGSSYYSCSGQLSFSGLSQVIVEGCGSGRQGGAADGNIPNSGRTEIRYVGTGGVGNTDSFIVGSPCRVIGLEGLVIRYSSTSYAGDLVSFYSPGSSGNISVHNWIKECLIGGTSATACNARSLVFFRNNVGGGIEHSTLMLAVRGVIGRGCLADGTLGTSFTFSNSVSLHKVKFDYLSGYAVCNPGAQWSLTECIFEFGPDMKGRAISTEDSVVNGGWAHTLDCKALSVKDCGFWDATEGGTWVKLRAKGVKFDNCFVTLYNDTGNGGTKDGKFLELWGDSSDRCHSIGVEYCAFDGAITNGVGVTTSFNNLYIDQSNASVIGGIGWHCNAGNGIPIPPPPGLSYDPIALSTLHYTTITKTPSGGIINLDLDEGHAFINATANTIVRLDEDAVFGYLQGRVMTVTRTDASTNTCVVVGKNGATINGRTDGFPLTQYQTTHFLCVDGTNWVTFSGVAGARKGTDVCIILPKNSFAGTSTTDVISDSNNAIKAMRFVVEEPTIVTKIAIRIGVAGNVMGLGIYDAAGNKLASADSISISAATTTVAPTLSASVLLQPNVSYFVAWAADTTTPTASSTAVIAVGNIELWNAGGNKNFVTAANSLVAGAMPATLGALTAVMVADAVPYLTLLN